MYMSLFWSCFSGVEWRRTTSNNTYEVEKTLGIEAARYFLQQTKYWRIYDINYNENTVQTYITWFLQSLFFCGVRNILDIRNKSISIGFNYI